MKCPNCALIQRKAIKSIVEQYIYTQYHLETILIEDNQWAHKLKFFQQNKINARYLVIKQLS